MEFGKIKVCCGKVNLSCIITGDKGLDDKLEIINVIDFLEKNKQIHTQSKNKTCFVCGFVYF